MTHPLLSPGLERENSLLGLFLNSEFDRPEDHIDEIFQRFESQQQQALLKRGGDLGQRSKAAMGRGLQRLVQVLVEDQVTALNRGGGLDLRCTTDQALRRKNPDQPLDRVKRNLLVDYGDYGCHLPDADVVVYRAENLAVVCVVSVKASLRDRMKQTAYWKLKLQQSPITTHVRMCLITLDKDGDLINEQPPHKKNYAIANTDLDATYVLRRDLTPHDRIKHFSSFEDDLKLWGGGG